MLKVFLCVMALVSALIPLCKSAHSNHPLPPPTSCSKPVHRFSLVFGDPSSATSICLEKSPNVTPEKPILHADFFLPASLSSPFVDFLPGTMLLKIRYWINEWQAREGREWGMSGDFGGHYWQATVNTQSDWDVLAQEGKTPGTQ